MRVRSLHDDGMRAYSCKGYDVMSDDGDIIDGGGHE